MRYRILLQEEIIPIVPGVSRAEYYGVHAQDVFAVTPEVITYEEGNGVRGYITVGPEPESYERAAVYDARMQSWQVYPPADNDDYRTFNTRPGV